jgi:cytolysin (calcineurin-like family phosphatase)
MSDQVQFDLSCLHFVLPHYFRNKAGASPFDVTPYNTTDCMVKTTSSKAMALMQKFADTCLKTIYEVSF